MVKARIVTVDVAFLCNKRQQQTKKLILLHENSVKKHLDFHEETTDCNMQCACVVKEALELQHQGKSLAKERAGELSAQVVRFFKLPFSWRGYIYYHIRILINRKYLSIRFRCRIFLNHVISIAKKEE